MRRISSTLTMLLAALAMAGMVVVPNVSHAKKKDKPEVKLEEGQVAVEEEVLDDLSDAAYLYMDDAREHFKEGEFDAAAEDYRTAASLLRLEAGRSAQKYEGELIEEAERMEKFADKIEDKAVANLEEFDKEATHAFQSLSEHHYERAMEQWAEKQYNKAAQSMRQAARQMERSANWGEQKIEKEYEDAIEDTREAANKIDKQSEWAASQVADNFKQLGEKIKKWGKKIEKEATEE